MEFIAATLMKPSDLEPEASSSEEELVEEVSIPVIVEPIKKVDSKPVLTKNASQKGK